jgi:hypothetical protein
MSASQSTVVTFLFHNYHGGHSCHRCTSMFCCLQTTSLAHPWEDHLRVYTPDHLRVGLASWEEGQMPEGGPAQGLSLLWSVATEKIALWFFTILLPLDLGIGVFLLLLIPQSFLCSWPDGAPPFFILHDYQRLLATEIWWCCAWLVPFPMKRRLISGKVLTRTRYSAREISLNKTTTEREEGTGVQQKCFLVSPLRVKLDVQTMTVSGSWQRVSAALSAAVRGSMQWTHTTENVIERMKAYLKPQARCSATGPLPSQPVGKLPTTTTFC